MVGIIQDARSGPSPLPAGPAEKPARYSPVSDTLPGFEAYEWNGVFVPHGTPPSIVRTLNGAINEAIQAPDVKERFEQLNIESRPNTPEEFRAFVGEGIFAR